MYEYMPSGLGWETLFERNWYGGQSETPLTCMELVDRGVSAAQAQQRCFKDTAPERTLAAQAECVRIGWPCQTSGEEGSTWCCPPGNPDRQVPEGSVTPEEPEITVVLPSGGDPRPLYQHSFWSRLSHPGAIAALGLVAVTAYLGYKLLFVEEQREDRYA